MTPDVGFPATKEVKLVNSSIVPIYYEAKVLHDGDIPALTCEAFANLTDKANPTGNIKEFILTPQTGTAQAEETLTLQV